MQEHSDFDWVTDGEFEYRYVGELHGHYDEYFIKLKGQEKHDMVLANKLYDLLDKFIKAHPEFETQESCTVSYIHSSGLASLKRKRTGDDS